MIPKPSETNEDVLLEKRKLIRLLAAKKIAETRIDFALNYHRNTRGQHLNFDQRAYQKQWYVDPAPEITLRVPVQIGKTEWQVCDTLAAAYLGMGVFCVQPKFELRGVHVAERYDKLIAASPDYQRMEQEGGTGRSSTTLKHFGRGTLRFVGSRVETDMISFPADAVMVDELDRCDLKMLYLAEDRLEESEYQLVRRTSSPRLPGSKHLQNIDWYFMLGNQQRWYVPCPACGLEQEIRWDTHLLRIVRDAEGRIVDAKLMDDSWAPRAWEASGRRLRIKLPCLRCREPLDRLAPGRWIAHNPSVKEHSSYTMSRLVASSSTVEKIWLQFEVAVGNPKKMERVFNSLFGEPYYGIGDRLTEDLLDKATLVLPPYHYPAKPVGSCTMGIDVNRPFFDVWISDYPLFSVDKVIRRLVYAGKVIDEAKLFELAEQYGVRMCCVDAEPETRWAINFQRKAPFQVWRVQYRHTLEGISPKDWQVSERDKVITIDRTSALDDVYASFVRGETALPLNYQSLCDGQLATELLLPVRVLESDNGIDRYVWSGEGAHAIHACNYDHIASRKGNFGPAGLTPDITTGVVSGQAELRQELQEYERFAEPLIATRASAESFPPG